MQNPRFGGISRVYSEKGYQELKVASVAVVGIGGVGSWVAEALVRSGIGSITLIDLDDICVTNTNRQIHALGATIGQLKVEAMAERLLAINPDCVVKIHADFINKDNLSTYLGERFNYVVDAIDHAKTKAAIIAFCKRNKIKVLTVGGAGGQIDPLQVSVSDLSRSWQDPLSAKVRSELRRFYNFSKNPERRFGVECVFSTEQLIYPAKDGQISFEKPHRETSIKLDCEEGLGASVSVTATFGMVAASRVLNYLAKAKTLKK